MALKGGLRVETAGEDHSQPTIQIFKKLSSFAV